MSAPATRRAALGAILAAPLASVPAVAVSGISADERKLLAIGPQLIRLLNEYDHAWAPVSAAYAVYEKASEHLPVSRWAEHEKLPEWQNYIALRVPADVIAEAVDSLYDPFWNTPLTTIPAILLRHRYGMSFDSAREAALKDLDRLWQEGRACA